MKVLLLLLRLHTRILSLQGYPIYKKTHPPRTLPQAYD